MKIKGALTAFFVLIFWFYLKQASPVVTTGDSGEFITAAATLSLPHAPSFPLFTLMGRVFFRRATLGFRIVSNECVFCLDFGRNTHARLRFRADFILAPFGVTNFIAPISHFKLFLDQ
jgi:hypothetical protein